MKISEQCIMGKAKGRENHMFQTILFSSKKYFVSLEVIKSDCTIKAIYHYTFQVCIQLYKTYQVL